MSDLISREKALEALYDARVRVMGMRIGKTILSEYAKQCRDAMINAIKGVPGADAEYIRHGYWIEMGKTEKGSRILKCSCCKTERKGVSKSAYCKDCGCKMDAGVIDISDEATDEDDENEFTHMNRNVHNFAIDESESYEQENYWPKENPYCKDWT